MENSTVGWSRTTTISRTQVSFGWAVSLWAVGDRGNQDFLVWFSLNRGRMSSSGGDRKKGTGKDMGRNMWGRRILIFPRACNLLIYLVAGEGFEPSTFGLCVRWALVINRNQRHEWQLKAPSVTVGKAYRGPKMGLETGARICQRSPEGLDATKLFVGSFLMTISRPKVSSSLKR
jgi:hypothetical protein